MDNPFLKALFVQPPEVLGRQLLPLSAYHVAALMLLDSPFTQRGATATPEDLTVAVWVCSHGYKTGPASLFPVPPQEEIAKWGHSFDFAAELADFDTYLQDYMDLPEVWTDSENSKDSGMPSPFHAVATVMRHMPTITEERAWDMPFSLLACYKCAIGEEHGWEIVSERQKELIALRDKLNAEAKANNGDS